MVVESLAGHSVFLDTAPIIYFVEGGTVFHPVLQRLFKLQDSGEVHMHFSVVSLMEVLVKPLRDGNMSLFQSFQNVFSKHPHSHLWDTTAAIAEEAAKIRAKHSFKTPDAILLATATLVDADFFVTNDLQLNAATGLPVLQLSAFL